jgi:hypothetical protein
MSGKENSRVVIPQLQQIFEADHDNRRSGVGRTQRRENVEPVIFVSPGRDHVTLRDGRTSDMMNARDLVAASWLPA